MCSGIGFADKGGLSHWRIPILYCSMQQEIEKRREIHHNTFDYRVTRLCAYPEHGGENFNLLLTILDGPNL